MHSYNTFFKILEGIGHSFLDMKIIFYEFNMKFTTNVVPHINTTFEHILFCLYNCLCFYYITINVTELNVLNLFRLRYNIFFYYERKIPIKIVIISRIHCTYFSSVPKLTMIMMHHDAQWLYSNVNGNIGVLVAWCNVYQTRQKKWL